MSSPLVSVLMPVYNAAPYVYASLHSILTQTYKNLEIIIVDDASTDASMDVVYSFCDSRILCLRNAENVGLAASLNKAIAIAQGKYIARMDADDIAHGERIEKQVAFMENNADVDVLGSSMKYFGYSSYLNFFPQTHEACKSYLMLNVCFGHPSVMLRRSVFSEEENYYKKELLQYSEEYDLWCRLVDKFRFHNLQEVLLYYRTYPPSIKGEAEGMRKVNSSKIRRDYLSKYLIDFSDEDFACHLKIALMERVTDIAELSELDHWLLKVVDLNNKRDSFDAELLKHQLARRFFEVCYLNAHLGVKAMKYYHASFWARIYRPDAKLVMKYLVKIVLSK